MPSPECALDGCQAGAQGFLSGQAIKHSPFPAAGHKHKAGSEVHGRLLIGRTAKAVGKVSEVVYEAVVQRPASTEGQRWILPQDSAAPVDRYVSLEGCGLSSTVVYAAGLSL